MNKTPSFSTQILHVFVLSMMSVAAPLLNVLSHNGQFFVVRDSTAADVTLMLLVLCLIIPALFVFIEWIVLKVFGRNIQSAIHLIFVFLFLFLFFMTLANRHPSTSGFLLASCALLSAICAVVLYRLQPLLSFLSLLAPSLVVIPIAFLIHYPASRIEKIESIPISSSVPMVMVVFDELPLTSLLSDANQIDASRFPNFASFAKQATWYRQATSVCELTEYAVPAILTGNFPGSFKPADISSYPRNLFTMMQTSYQMKTVECISRLCPRKSTIIRYKNFKERTISMFMDLSVVYLNILLPPDMRGRIPSVNNAWGDFLTTPSMKEATPRRLEIFRDFVNTIQPWKTGSRPVLYFLHVALPHYPYEYLPSGMRYDPENDLVPFTQTNTDADACALQYRRYTMQAMFTDKLLGELIDRLHRTDLYDRSLVIVIADHGVSFLPGKIRRMPTKETAFDLMHIPLIIKFPGQTSGVVTDRDAQTIDVLPTIAGVLKTKLPWKLDGRSLLENPVVREKKILNGKKHRWEVYPAQEDHFDAALQYQTKLLEQFPDVKKDDAYLIGQSTDRITVRGVTDYSIRLTNPDELKSVDLRTGFLPAFISGKIEGASPPSGVRFLVSVNHTVCAVTPVAIAPTDSEPIHGIRVFVPESAFQIGNNTVDVFAIVNPAKNVVMRVPIQPAQ